MRITIRTQEKNYSPIKTKGNVELTIDFNDQCKRKLIIVPTERDIFEIKRKKFKGK